VAELVVELVAELVAELVRVERWQSTSTPCR
jgi:hypothetical protein